MTTSHNGGSASIPRIDPSEWENHQGFRETLLLHFTEPKTNTALRKVGGLLFDLVLESSDSWPDWPEGTTRAELRAAIADLRHLEGFLASVGQEHLHSSLDFGETALSQFAALQAGEVGKIADQIEAKLEEWAGSAK